LNTNKTPPKVFQYNNGNPAELLIGAILGVVTLYITDIWFGKSKVHENSVSELNHAETSLLKNATPEVVCKT